MDLKNFLKTLPEKFGHKWSEEAKKEIMKSLKTYLAVSTSTKCFSSVCGHVFKRGEGNYRCRDCGLDDTCVMCSKCFHATDHTSHDVTFSVSSSGGGVCDCGDPEAWKVPLICKIHSANTTSAEQGSSDLQEIQRLRRLIGVLLDYSIAVVARLGASTEDPRQVTERTSLPQKSQIQETYEGYEEFAAVLLNDEHHSFDQVINTAMDALKCTEREARTIAEFVDVEGRKVVSESRSIDDLLRICRIFRSIGLGCNVRPATEIFQENIVMCIGQYLAELCSESDALWYSLMMTFNRSSAIGAELLTLIDAETVSSEYLEIGKDRSVSKMREMIYSVMNADVSCIEGPELESLAHCSNRNITLRLDLLFVYDIHLWKKLRNDLKKVLVSATKERTTKLAAAMRFFFTYHIMADNFLHKDREHELNVIFLSVQLFTTPTISKYLTKNTNILARIIQIMKSYFTKPSVNVLDFESLKSRKYVHFFRDLEYLWSGSQVAGSFLSLADTLKIYIDFINLFSEMDPVKREANVHIEYESEGWTHAFNLTYVLSSNIVKLVDWIASAGSNQIETCVRTVLEILNHVGRNFSYEHSAFPLLSAADVVKYDLLKEPVSFHHPIGWLFGALVGNLRSHSSEFAEAANTYCIAFDDIMEMGLRSVVAVSQHRAGLWVRNGYSFLNQVYNYTRMSLRGETYDCDLIVMAFMAKSIPTPKLLLTLLSRYNLQSIFLGGLRSSIDPRQISTLLEEFYRLLLHLLTDTAVLSNEKSDDDILKMEIIHALGVGPLAYSAIEKNIPHRLLENPNLNTILNQLATLKLPQKMEDSGKYELKQEYLELIEPYFVHQLPGKREETKRYLTERKLGTTRVVKCRPEMMRLFSSSEFLYLLWRCLFLATATSQDDLKISVQTVEIVLHVIGSSLDNSIALGYIKAFSFSFEGETKSFGDLLSNLSSIEDYSDLEKLTAAILKNIVPNYSASIESEPTTAKNDLAADEKKKAADERQARIMAQFLQQQSAFADAHSGLYDEIDSDMDENLDDQMDVDVSCFLPTGTCIICQEHVDKSSQEVYGMAACASSSHVVSHLETASLKDLIPTESCRYLEWSSRGSRCSFAPFGLHASSCGHLMHLRCHDQYIKVSTQRRVRMGDNNQEFLCPLCKSFCNVIIPIYFHSEDTKIVGGSDELRMTEWIDDIKKTRNALKIALEAKFDASDSITFLEKIRSLLSIEESDDDYSERYFLKKLFYSEKVPEIEDEYFLTMRSSFMKDFDSKLSPSHSSEFNEIVDLTEFAPEYQPYLLTSSVRDALNSLDVSFATWRCLAYKIKCLKILHENTAEIEVTNTEASVITVLSNIIIQPVNYEPDETYSECRFYKILDTVCPESEDPQPCLLNDTFEYLLAFLSSELARDKLTHSGSLDFFFMHAVTRYLLELIRFGSPNVVREQGAPPILDVSSAPVISYMTALVERLRKLLEATNLSADTINTFRHRKLLTISAIGEAKLQEEVAKVCLDLSDNIDLLSRYSVPMLSPAFRADKTALGTDRVLALMRAPDEIRLFLDLTDSYFEFIKPVVIWELEQWTEFAEQTNQKLDMQSILDNLQIPTLEVKKLSPYRLIDLPNSYQDLIEESLAFICETCNTNPINPALCLICGTYLCASTYCCMENGKGECHTHMAICGSSVGIFLLVKRCSILLMSGNQGCLLYAPYMDSHGETDVGLRRGKPQYLNKTRHQEIQRMWLKHEIPTVISRKRESNGNDGGWEFM